MSTVAAATLETVAVLHHLETMTRGAPTIPATEAHRRAARLLVRQARAATLATAMRPGSAASGSPYASLVTVATDNDGSPILLLSALADHTANLEADSRMSLLVEDAGDLPNPQTGPRVSLLGRAERIGDGPRLERLARRFLSRHPAAAVYAGFADFAFWRMSVERAHYVGGFARAVWLEADLLLAPAVAEAFAETEPAVVEHMNADHADALAAYAQAFLGRRETGWRMTAVDADGFDLRRGGEDRVYRVAFDPPLAGTEEIRPRLVDLARRARERSSP